MAASLKEGQIYSLSFNSNACDLKTSDLQDLFGAHNKASIVVASFQEYDIAPATCIPKLPFVYSGNNKAKLSKSTYLRQFDSQTDKLDQARSSEISRILGDNYKLIVDVAMGEPANESEIESKEGVKDKSKPEWYGFIRLMCWVKTDTSAGSILLNDDELVTCVIPTGNKVSQYYIEGEDLEESRAYVDDSSPDKGCVAAYFPNAQLLLTSTHLAGTNKYGVPEEVFDKIRLTQLNTIDSSLNHLVRRCGNSLSETALVMCGDLNFRVESKYTSPEDKAKGGRDFKVIEKIATNGDGSQLSDMFEDHDRLHKLLVGSHDNLHKRSSISLPSATLPQEDQAKLELPNFMKGCADAVGETLLESAASGLSGNELLRPTFTFKVGAKYPRSYKDKRTPSWTDRILAKGYGRLLGPAKGGSASVLYCRSLPHVVCSDHEPVIAVIGLGHAHDLSLFSEEMAKKHESFVKQSVKDLELESDTDDWNLSPPPPPPPLNTDTIDCWGGTCSIM